MFSRYLILIRDVDVQVCVVGPETITVNFFSVVRHIDHRTYYTLTAILQHFQQYKFPSWMEARSKVHSGYQISTFELFSLHFLLDSQGHLKWLRDDAAAPIAMNVLTSRGD